MNDLEQLMELARSIEENIANGNGKDAFNAIMVLPKKQAVFVSACIMDFRYYHGMVQGSLHEVDSYRTFLLKRCEVE